MKKGEQYGDLPFQDKNIPERNDTVICEKHWPDTSERVLVSEG